MKCDRLYAGFSLQDIGTFTFTVTNDGDGKAYAVGTASGSYYQGALDNGSYDNDHGSFAAYLETSLDAAATLAGSAANWTVSWSNATLAYTIDNGIAGNFAVTLTTVAQHILGFTANLSSASTYTSTVRPYYVIAPRMGYTSANTGERWLEGQIRSVMTDGGKQAGVGPTTHAKLHRWVHAVETEEATFTHSVAASVPWTWEMFFAHVGVWEPIIVVQSTTAVIAYADSSTAFDGYLYGPTADFLPQMSFPDYYGAWNVPITMVINRRLYAPA